MSTQHRPADGFCMSRGDGWAGTYALTVQYALTDLLSDGTYVIATLTFEDTGEVRTVAVGAVTDGALVTIGGESIDTSDLVSVVIS